LLSNETGGVEACRVACVSCRSAIADFDKAQLKAETKAASQEHTAWKKHISEVFIPSKAKSKKTAEAKRPEPAQQQSAPSVAKDGPAQITLLFGGPSVGPAPVQINLLFGRVVIDASTRCAWQTRVRWLNTVSGALCLGLFVIFTSALTRP
jgi:hypothetical protein